MPTYDYICESCGYEFERFQSISARPIRKCPKCGKGSLKRLIGAGSGVIFKGTGFYQTDYRSESYKKAEKSEKTKTEKKKTETKTKDSKPADKTKPSTKNTKKSTRPSR
ncbi:MAG: FmdB family zinc ribbon protein [Planctomycetota bacterium]|jgi:putative FmdB family regulatory protein